MAIAGRGVNVGVEGGNLSGNKEGFVEGRGIIYSPEDDEEEKDAGTYLTLDKAERLEIYLFAV